MINRMASAAQSADGELVKVDLAILNAIEGQNFLTKEEQHWRG